MAALFIQVVRGALGRARPYGIDAAGDRRDAEPHDFEPPPSPGRCGGATPRTARRSVPALYAGAAMPALARLYLDEHWASDIAMGAFLGVFAGLSVLPF